MEPKQPILIICDNPECDYTIPNPDPNHKLNLELTKTYINKPCPKCGENLLTEQDYNDYVLLVNIINIIPEEPNPSDTDLVNWMVGVHNGQLNIRINGE